MSAYFVAEIEIATRLGSIPTERRSLARSHRDHFPTRGGTTELLERGRRRNRVVILEFPDTAAVKRWYDSS